MMFKSNLGKTYLNHQLQNAIQYFGQPASARAKRAWRGLEAWSFMPLGLQQEVEAHKIIPPQKKKQRRMDKMQRMKKKQKMKRNRANLQGLEPNGPGGACTPGP